MPRKQILKRNFVYLDKSVKVYVKLVFAIKFFIGNVKIVPLMSRFLDKNLFKNPQKTHWKFKAKIPQPHPAPGLETPRRVLYDTNPFSNSLDPIMQLEGRRNVVSLYNFTRTARLKQLSKVSVCLHSSS